LRNRSSKLSTPEEVIQEGIADLIKEPNRNFETHPLNQEEILSILHTLGNEVKRPDLTEDIVNYYIAVIDFLKTKILYN
jgi:hypothetical protein